MQEMSVRPTRSEHISIIEEIETFSVSFKTRVCGIELVPFENIQNLGAVVLRNHTEFAKQRVLEQSLLIAINGELCIDTDYDEILQIISCSQRPLNLTFHPPSTQKQKKINLRFSDAMKLNDEEDDAGNYWFDEYDRMTPKKIMNINDLNLIQKCYTMLYQKYCELQQFQDLIKDTVHDKMEEITRLNQQNMTLKSMVNVKQLEIERIAMNESWEKQKGKNNEQKYKQIDLKNIEMEKQNVSQKQQIIKLQNDLRQKKIECRRLKMMLNQRDYDHSFDGFMRKKNKNKKRNKNTKNNQYRSKSPNLYNLAKHNQSFSVLAEDKFQNELKNRLNARNNAKNQKSEKIDIAKPISLRTPTILNKDNQRRSRSTNGSKSKSNKIKTKTKTKSISISNQNTKQQQKRRSAIGLLFKNLTKRKSVEPSDQTLSAKQKNNKYHPQIAIFCENKQNKNKKKNKIRKTPKLSADILNQNENGFDLSPNKMRSNSLESNIGRQRKDTIV